MKGKTIIELKDAKGKKETFVDHNMITNALATFYQEAGMTNPSAFNTLLKTNPVENLLGGILCLDDTITESASIVKVPTGINMVANASWGVLNSGNPSELGSWNESESGWQQDGSYKCVYDFTQSQGNGVIKSVCLTSKLGGLRGIGNASKTSRAAVQSEETYNSYDAMTGVTGTPIALKNNKLYSVASIGENGWTLNEYGFNTTRTDIRNTKAARLIRSIAIQTPADIISARSRSVLYGGDRYYYGVQTHYQKGDYVYVVYAIRGTRGSLSVAELSADNPVYIVKIDLVNMTATIDATLTPSVVGFTSGLVNSSSYVENKPCTMGITDKYMLFRRYLIDLSNPSDVTEFQDMAEMLNDGTTMDSDHIQISNNRIDCPEAIVLPANGGISYRNYADVNALVHLTSTSDGVFLWRDPSYIASINNLEQAVEKTGDKTMKITYIITF